MHSNTILQELIRKSIHLTSVVIVIVYFYAGKNAVMGMLILFLLLFLIIENARLKYNISIPLLQSLFRKNEISHPAGHIYFIIGAIISISIFSYEIASAAILMATFGDLSAALIGKKYGRTKIFHGPKSLEGSLSALIVNFVIGYLFLGGWPVAVIMALSATLAELWFTRVDDNLAIPIFSGSVGHIAVLIISNL